jgi:uncharacterized membrane protein
MTFTLAAIGFLVGLWLFTSTGSFAGAILAMGLGIAFARLLHFSNRQTQLTKEIRELQAQLGRANPSAHQATAEPPIAEPVEAIEPVEPAAIIFARTAMPPIPEPAPAPIEAAEPAPPIIARPPAPPTAKPAPGPIEASLPPMAPPPPDLFDRAISAATAWVLGGNAVARIGGIVLFLGLAFLLRYVAEHVEIPVEVYYIAVALFGAGLLGIGWRLRRTRRHYALLLQGVGTAILYLTIFAAMRLNPLLSPGTGFILMVLLVGFWALLAVAEDAPAMAVTAALGGFAAPILAPSSGDHHVTLLSYLLLLDVGIAGIAWFKAWRPLNLVGFSGTVLVVGLWAATGYQQAMLASTEPFALLYFLLFVAIGFLFARRRLRETPDAPSPGDPTLLIRWAFAQANALDGILLFGTPWASFAWQTRLIEPHRTGAAWTALGIGLFYLGLAAWLRRQSPWRYAALREVFLVLGVMFITIAVPLGLDETLQVAAAWAVEGAGLYWIALRQQRRIGSVFAALVQLGAALVYLATLHHGDATRLIAGSRLGAVLLAASFLSSALLQQRHRRMPRQIEDVPFRRLFSFGGLFFLALLAPLSFAAAGTVIALAALGLAALAVGLGRGERVWSAGGLLIEAAAGIILLGHFSIRPNGIGLFLAGSFWAPMALALAGFAGAWLQLKAERSGGAVLRLGVGQDPLSSRMAEWAAWWWALGWGGEILRGAPAAMQANMLLLVAALSAHVWSEAARVWRWPALAGLAALLVPAAWILLIASYATIDHPAAQGGWVAWPAVVATHLALLRRTQALLPLWIQSWLHVAGTWLILAVLALELRYGVRLLTDRIDAWHWLGWAAVPALYLLAAARQHLPARWPLTDFAREYRLLTAAPLAALLLAWVGLSALMSDGDAAPLPYLPLANPLELGQTLALLALTDWYRILRAGSPWAEAWPAERASWIVGTAILLLLTGSVLRTAHHWAGVPYTPERLIGSMTVQAGLSVVWAVSALALMIGGHLRHLRAAWLAGAALMAIVVVKLFLVELTSVGGVPRIVSFIGVGALLLVTGYFAPLPPKRPALAGDGMNP